MPRESLAEFELFVVMAAVRLGRDEAYTVSIADVIEERTGRSVRRATVHTTVHRLEAKRLLDTRLSEPRAERGGKPRRLVEVRPEGVRAAQAAAGAIRAMADGLDALGDVV